MHALSVRGAVRPDAVTVLLPLALTVTAALAGAAGSALPLALFGIFAQSIFGRLGLALPSLSTGHALVSLLTVPLLVGFFRDSRALKLKDQARTIASGLAHMQALERALETKTKAIAGLERQVFTSFATPSTLLRASHALYAATDVAELAARVVALCNEVAPNEQVVCAVRTSDGSVHSASHRPLDAETETRLRAHVTACAQSFDRGRAARPPLRLVDGPPEDGAPFRGTRLVAEVPVTELGVFALVVLPELSFLNASITTWAFLDALRPVVRQNLVRIVGARTEAEGEEGGRAWLPIIAWRIKALQQLERHERGLRRPHVLCVTPGPTSEQGTRAAQDMRWSAVVRRLIATRTADELLAWDAEVARVYLLVYLTDQQTVGVAQAAIRERLEAAITPSTPSFGNVSIREVSLAELSAMSGSSVPERLGA